MLRKSCKTRVILNSTCQSLTNQRKEAKTLTPVLRGKVHRLKALFVDKQTYWVRFGISPVLAVGIMGLRENFDWDGGVGEPYWGPSAEALCCVLGKNFEDP